MARPSPSPRKSSSSSSRRGYESSSDRGGRGPPRDPSDDQAVALVSRKRREHEWNDVVRDGNGDGNGGGGRAGGGGRRSEEEEEEPPIEPQQRQRANHGLVHDKRRDERRRQQRQEEKEGRRERPPQKQGRGEDRGQARGDRGQQEKDGRGRKTKPSLGQFIGRQKQPTRPPPRDEEEEREALLPVIEAVQSSSASAACSALTTPSGLMTAGSSGISAAASEHKHDDDDDRRPLLKNGRGGGGDKKSSQRGGEGRARYSEKYQKNRGSNKIPRGGDARRRSRSRDDDASRDTSSAHSSAHSSSLSNRRNGNGGEKKRPWFANSSLGKSKFNNSGNGNAHLGTTGLGVQYRSATSTQRALEDLRRKKIEAQEKKRAVSILAVLFTLAVLIHFAGGSWSGAFGMGKKDERLRGSRDKEYGETKELGYGGERAAAAAMKTTATKGDADRTVQMTSAGGGGAGYGDEYEYEIPPPKEKEYDAEHEFLLPLKHFSDVTDPQRPTDTAFFFHVPRAGGSTMKDVIGKCLKLVQASEVGIRDGHGSDPKLAVLEVHESRYINVDTTTVVGIQRAVDLGLGPSGMADVVVSSYFHESAALFDLQHQGRAFILLRDPIERAISMYWHRIKELGDLETSVTIEDYAQGNGIENNWMCRFLANRMTGELTKDDLEQAKEILRDKFLVGFVDDLEETVHRIMKFQGWKFDEDETKQMNQEDCIKDLASEEGGSNVNPYEYEVPKRGTQAHALISWQTQFDGKLYAYARELFDIQTKEWGTKERKKALKKEKKKKGH